MDRNTAVSATRPQPELGRLKAASERVAMVTNKMINFVERFHGPQPGGASATAPSLTDNYRNDLDTLFTEIVRLEDAANSLDEIG